MNYITGVVNDIGIEKETNQDSVLLKTGNYKNYNIAFSVVCDGMGGLSDGELASAHVVTKLSDWFDNKLIDFLDDEVRWDEIRKNLESIIVELNRQLFSYGKRNHLNLGTTITGILIINNHYMVINVGDSRTYLVNKGIRQITEDQSLVAREVKMGKMTWEEAEYDKRRNVLLQCIGATQNVEIEVYEGETGSEDGFLLCSDGFRHEIEIFEREGKIEEGIYHIFSKFYEDREFYRKAFEITGQNGFADTLSDMFTSFYKEAASRNLKIVKETKLSVDTVARYYSSGLITVLKMLVGDNGSESLEDFLYGYRYLISHALYDI